MPGTSRRVESPLSGSAVGASSRDETAPHSGTARGNSSRTSSPKSAATATSPGASRELGIPISARSSGSGGRSVAPHSSAGVDQATSRLSDSRGGIVPLEITNVNFVSYKNAITVEYDTNAPTKCYISYRIHGGFIWARLLILTYHSGGHSHQITGLTPNTQYDIIIYVTDAYSRSDRSPEPPGSYYVVSTADEFGVGGGLEEIYYP